MGRLPGQYNMQCWHSTENPADMDRAQLLDQCFKLIRALQQQFTNDEIAVPSTERESNKKGIEICILYQVDTDLFADIADFLSSKAQSLGLAYRKFVKQDAGITRYFTKPQLENIAHLDRQVPDEFDEGMIRAHLDKMEQFEGFRSNETWREGVSADHRSTPLMLSRSSLKRLHTLEGNDLMAEIKYYMEAITAAAHEPKTGIGLIHMIASGVVTVTSHFVAIPGALEIYSIFLAWNTGAGIAFAIGAAPFALVAGIVLRSVYLFLKDALNVLLVVNDTSNDVLPIKEWIEHGDRRSVPEMIHAAPANSDFVWCGLFLYSKYQINTYSVGYYGSSFGVSFATAERTFSVGMSCPNSLLGGRNSAEVINQEDAHKACEMARSSACAHGWCSGPYVDVKIADSWGSVNWARAIVMKD